MIRFASMALAASAHLLASPSAPPVREGSPTVDGIVLIVIDDIGSESLSWWPQAAHASAPPPTPNMEALAQSGVIFSQFYAQPLCSPSRASLLTGRYAIENSLGSITGDTESLATTWNTIPSILQQTTELACGAFGKWHLGAVGDHMHPIDMGFDYFSGTEANVQHLTSAPTSHHFDWWKVVATSAGASYDQVVGPWNDESTYSLSVTGQDARQWIQQQTGPYLAYVSFNVPHAPQQVPPHTMLSAATVADLPPHFVAGYEALNREEGRAIYRLAIEALDNEIGRLVGVTTPDTMVLVLSDNGTPPLLCDPLWGRHGKGTVYNAGTRVPMFVSGPLVQYAGSVCEELVSVVDVRDTVVSLAAGVLPAEPPAPGLDFTSLIQDPSSPGARTFAFTQRFAPNGAYTPDPATPAPKTLHDRGIANTRMHYLRKDFDAVAGTYVEEAYDLRADPFQVHDLLHPSAAPSSAQSAMIAILSQEVTSISGL